MSLKNSEVYDRLTSESPDFFKRLRNYALIVGIVIPAITGSVVSAGITLPLWLIVVSGAITSICAGIAGTSTLTKK